MERRSRHGVVHTKGDIMPKKTAPPSKPQAPDPSDCYERSHPENESGQGRLDNNSKATPTARPDKMPASVTHAQDGSRQINAQEAASKSTKPVESEMNEEPLGWDWEDEAVRKAKS